MSKKIPNKYFLNGYSNIKKYLWPHQEDAVQFVAKYVKEYNSNTNNKARLVSLPTGSGKSGIIATLARYLPINKCILVIVPRNSLRTQLYEDISGRFFRKAKISGSHPKNVEIITGSSNFFFNFHKRNHKLRSWHAKQSISSYILVTTVQLLERIWAKAGRFKDLANDTSSNTSVSEEDAKEIVNTLISQVGLVFFDEGHYEPALKWAQVIRSFNTPRVIFTATPFRNDLRGFDWATDLKDVFHRSFMDMVQANIIRDVTFIPFKIGGTNLETIKKIEAQREHLCKDFGEEVEVLIRVGSRARVLELANAVDSLDKKYQAIHHRKSTKAAVERGEPFIDDNYKIDISQHIPYWIHQFKLIEGIDRPQISILVILDKLTSLRALVQQIGRVTRLKNNDVVRSSAIILDPHGDMKRLWEHFIKYEYSLKNGFKNRSAEALFDQILNSINTAKANSPIYADGKIRDIINPTQKGGWATSYDVDWRTDVLVRKSAQVLELINPRKDWPTLCNNILHSAQESFDKDWQVFRDNKVLLIFGVSSTSSPHLNAHAFLDIKLDVVLCLRLDPFIFYYDSSGKDIRSIASFLKLSNANNILRLLKQFNKQRLRSVSIKNTRIGPSITTSKTLRGIDLTATAFSIDDSTHIVTSAIGYTVDEKLNGTTMEKDILFRRRIGLPSRRVSDAGSMIDINTYIEWAKEISSDLMRKDQSQRTEDNPQNTIFDIMDYFKRFSTEAGHIPAKWQPTWLLIDIAQYEGEHVLHRVSRSNNQAMPYNNQIDSPDDSTEEIDTTFPILKSGLISLSSSNGKASSRSKLWEGTLEFTNNPNFSVWVKFNSKQGKYILISDTLDSYRALNKPDGNTLLQDLNQSQSFSILPEEEGYFYTMGSFFKPGLGLGPSYNDQKTGLLDMLIQIPSLKYVKSEKGLNDQLTDSSITWPEDSLFGLIDAAAKKEFDSLSDGNWKTIASTLHSYMGDVIWLVCDDMGSERADFIALTKRGNDTILLLIHAKRGKHVSKVSATQLQDVCSQAIKNLDFLGPRQASHTRDWNNAWTITNNNVAIPRIRVVPKDLNSKALNDPSSLSSLAADAFDLAVSNPSISREVWLVTGPILSKTAFDNILKARSRRKEEIPSIYLLYATSTVVASTRSRLRVFCY